MMRNAKRVWLPGMALVCAALLGGCQQSTPVRVASDQEVALTDAWNATDSRLVAEAMMQDMLTFPWVHQFRGRQGRAPVVIVQNIRNRSHEHIPVETFINDLKRELLRSGQVQFVAQGSTRQDLRDERADQELHARIETQAAMGEETGADFALSGTINSLVDRSGGSRVTFYQVDLTLIDLSTNQEVWYGQKKIQKVFERPRFSL